MTSTHINLNQLCKLSDQSETTVAQAAEQVKDMFDYHPWDEDQKGAGEAVRESLAAAFNTILMHVPPSADRSAALRKLREARMDANSAITHNGKY